MNLFQTEHPIILAEIRVGMEKVAFWNEATYDQDYYWETIGSPIHAFVSIVSRSTSLDDLEESLCALCFKTHATWRCYLFMLFHMQSAFRQSTTAANIQPHVSLIARPILWRPWPFGTCTEEPLCVGKTRCIAWFPCDSAALVFYIVSVFSRPSVLSTVALMLLLQCCVCLSVVVCRLWRMYCG